MDEIKAKEVLELALLGVVVGAASGFFGIGGGTILVPALIALGYDIKVAIATSVVQMVFASSFGSWVNYRSKKLNIGDGAALGVGGFLGALQSGWIVQVVPEKTLLLTFAGVLVFTLLRFLKTPSVVSGEPVRSIWVLFGVGFVVGMVAISIGVGGGLFLTPLLVGFMRYDMKQAISMSLFFVVFSSFSGLFSMLYYGVVDVKLGVLLGVASLLGVYVGAKQAHQVERVLQKRLLLTLYVVLLGLVVNKLLG